MAQRTALIVGAGIGGLAAGIALRRAGWAIRIFERAANPREIGFALNLAPNALAALREVGVADRIIAEGHAPRDVELRAADGRVLKRLNVAATLSGAQSLVALRPVLHGALMSALAPDVVELNSEVSGFDVAGDRATLLLTDGRSAVGDVIVGADGIHSIIRKLLHPRGPALRRSGYYAVRGVAQDAEHHLGSLSAVVYYGHGIEAAAARAGQQAVYWYMSLLAEDLPDATAAADVIAERFATMLDEQFRSIVDATHHEDMRLDELYDRDPIPTWGTDRVTLLGDAAHPMLPHAGQGAAQALEDAVALGSALASGNDVSAALRRYELVRAERTRKIVRIGRRIARTTTTKNPLIGWLRAIVIRVVPAKLLLLAFG